MTILRLANICRLSGLFCLAAVAASMTAVGQGQPEAILTAQGRFNQLYDVGRFAEAVPVAEEVLALIKSRGGETGSEYGAALYQLGNVIIGVSRPDDERSFPRAAFNLMPETKIMAFELFGVGQYHLAMPARNMTTEE